MVGRRGYSDSYADEASSSRASRGIGVAAGAVVFAVSLVVALITFGQYEWSNTAFNEGTCVWNGGPFDNKGFKAYYGPRSGRNGVGFHSKVVDIPTDVRNYKISLDPTISDSGVPDQIKTTISGISMGLEPKMQFFFNHRNIDVAGQQIPMACVWWEEQGKRFVGDPDFNDRDGNWAREYLPQQFRPAVFDTFQRTAQEMARLTPDLPRALYLNQIVDVRTQAEKDETKDAVGNIPFLRGPARDLLAERVGRDLPVNLARLFGGRQVFCGAYLAADAAQEAPCAPFQVVIDRLPTFDNPDILNQFSAAEQAAVARSTAVAKATEEAQQAQQTAEIAANSAKAVAEANARKAAAEAASAVELANAETTKAEAQRRIEAANAIVEQEKARAKMADCLVLPGATLIDCAWLRAFEQGKVPTVIGGADAVNVTPPAP